MRTTLHDKNFLGAGERKLFQRARTSDYAFILGGKFFQRFSRIYVAIGKDHRGIVLVHKATRYPTNYG